MDHPVTDFAVMCRTREQQGKKDSGIYAKSEAYELSRSAVMILDSGGNKLKRIVSAALAMVLCLTIVTSTLAAQSEESTVNYMTQMISAAVAGDYDKGTAAEQARNAKIDREGLSYTKISFEDLYMLAKIMYAEAGSNWLSEEWKMSVGEVVLNRVASPEFPNTVTAVITQKGQYYGTSSRYFTNLKPSEECVKLALRLLLGERVLNQPAVVFQANFAQGSGVYVSYYDKHLGTTYLCYSSKMYLYQA